MRALTQRHWNRTARELNHRRRKRYGARTPIERLAEHLADSTRDRVTSPCMISARRIAEALPRLLRFAIAFGDLPVTYGRLQTCRRAALSGS